MQGARAVELPCLGACLTHKLQSYCLRGADPFTANDHGKTPLASATEYNRLKSIELLKAALVEPQRVRTLHKLRLRQDAEHAITKARNDAASDMPEERKKNTIAAAPAHPKRRVEADEALPVIEARYGRDEEEERIVAAAEYFTANNQLPKEVFVELMDMMLPPWDEGRNRR